MLRAQLVPLVRLELQHQVELAEGLLIAVEEHLDAQLFLERVLQLCGVLAVQVGLSAVRENRFFGLLVVQEVLWTQGRLVWLRGKEV